MAPGDVDPRRDDGCHPDVRRRREPGHGRIRGHLLQDAVLDIGSYVYNGTLYNQFVGSIDEVRWSSVVWQTANFTPPTGPYSGDPETTLLMHFDDAAEPLLENQYDVNTMTLPALTDAGDGLRGPDFLDEDCGVEWFNPTPSGSTYASIPTLIVSQGSATRTPSYATRGAGINDSDSYNSPDETLWSYGSTQYDASRRPPIPASRRPR